jgi:hypothetical protein
MTEANFSPPWFTHANVLKTKHLGLAGFVILHDLCHVVSYASNSSLALSRSLFPIATDSSNDK